MFELKQLYCFADPLFFEDVSRWSDGPGRLADGTLSVSARPLPDGWTRTERGVWTSLHPPGESLPAQGWKIHISATPDNADRLCRIAWDYCVPRGIPFKHLRDRNLLIALNAKYAPRGASGKLVTIYPEDEDRLHRILQDLAPLTEGEPGPYILSDLRWGDTALYVRYGGFTEMGCQDERGGWTYAVRRPDGVLVPDVRRPYFSPPDWVPLPEFLRPHLAARGGAAAMPYRVERALHFSNSGGIYLATRDGRKVVLKEARPHAGLDENHEDAVARQARERWALERLAGVDGVPALIDAFELGGHHFIAEEYVEGQPLHVWCGVHHPWVVNASPTPEDMADFTRRAVEIVDRLERLLDAIHARGVVFGDLHLGNVIVRPDGSPALIDFELAFDIADTEWRPGLRATGFGHPGKRGLDVDRYSAAAVRLAIFLMLSRIMVLDPAKAGQFVGLLKESFPIPDGWESVIRAELAPSPPARQPMEVEWPAAGKSVAAAILASATPSREDRLFPGAVEQFTPWGGASFAFGAAGVLWALSVTGHGRFPEHERWLLDAVRRSRAERPGFYDGMAGVAYVLDHLGHTAEAAELTGRLLDRAAEPWAMSLFSGLSGIGATLLHFGHLEEAQAVACRLAVAVERGEPQTGKSDVEAGLMRGWSGVALFLIRLHERTGDPAWLDYAVRALHHDLDHCVVTGDGALMVEEKGVRTLPYLDVGSGGIALVIDELLACRKDERCADSLPALLIGPSRRFAIQADLFRGQASKIATLARLTHRVDRRETLESHLRDLSWHAIPYRGELAFPGSLGFRLSMDLATGGAGVLLAMSTAAGGPFLPFFSQAA
ncbi:class III lanthionine synthetase LanKC [Nonomuraea sp. 10N515B]|uniref:class III lanthionine synthetase LanKC n=1 Tax=Nonomuraea sp. 10N515B TaxID=3457422 RepID=UPI003FCE1F64